MNLRRILSQTALIIGALIFSIGLQAYAQTFVQPSTGPTGGNAQAPLDTGPNPNTKAGALQVNGFANIGQSYFIGSVGIGTSRPITGAALDVEGGNVNVGQNLHVNGVLSANGGNDVSIPGYVVAGCYDRPFSDQSQASNYCWGGAYQRGQINSCPNNLGRYVDSGVYVYCPAGTISMVGNTSSSFFCGGNAFMLCLEQ